MYLAYQAAFVCKYTNYSMSIQDGCGSHSLRHYLYLKVVHMIIWGTSFMTTPVIVVVVKYTLDSARMDLIINDH